MDLDINQSFWGQCVVQENITQPKESYQKFQGGGGFKSPSFERKVCTKMEFLEGWRVQAEKPFVGGVWIFPGTTRYPAILNILLRLVFTSDGVS